MLVWPSSGQLYLCFVYIPVAVFTWHRSAWHWEPATILMSILVCWRLGYASCSKFLHCFFPQFSLVSSWHFSDCLFYLSSELLGKRPRWPVLFDSALECAAHETNFAKDRNGPSVLEATSAHVHWKTYRHEMWPVQRKVVICAGMDPLNLSPCNLLRYSSPWSHVKAVNIGNCLVRKVGFIMRVQGLHVERDGVHLVFSWLLCYFPPRPRPFLMAVQHFCTASVIPQV